MEGEDLDQRGDLGALPHSWREAVAGEAGEAIAPAELGGEQGEVGAGAELTRQGKQGYAGEFVAQFVEGDGLLPERTPQLLRRLPVVLQPAVGGVTGGVVGHCLIAEVGRQEAGGAPEQGRIPHVGLARGINASDRSDLQPGGEGIALALTAQGLEETHPGPAGELVHRLARSSCQTWNPADGLRFEPWPDRASRSCLSRCGKAAAVPPLTCCFSPFWCPDLPSLVANDGLSMPATTPARWADPFPLEPASAAQMVEAMNAIPIARRGPFLNKLRQMVVPYQEKMGPTWCIAMATALANQAWD